jgi:hypothetical protein
MGDSSIDSALDKSNVSLSSFMLPRAKLRTLLPPVPLIPKHFFSKEPLRTGRRERLL